MADQKEEKTALEKSRDLLSQFKDMEQYSKSNIEKLSEYWLMLDDELKQKEFAGRVEKIISRQNEFHQEIDAFISDYEIECNRIENEAQ